MKFILEAFSEVTKEDISNFNKLSGADRDQFVADVLKNLSNSKYLENNLVNYAKFISKYGFKHPYSKFILDLNRSIDPEIAANIEAMSVRNILDPSKEDSFLKNDSLWVGDKRDNIYRIKVLAMVDSDEYKRKYSDIEDFNIEALQEPNGDFLSAEDMKSKLNNWQEYLDTKYGRRGQVFSKDEQDAIDALINLRIDKKNAEALVKGLNMGGQPTDKIIQAALKAHGN